METTSCADATSFLRRSEDYRGRHPLLTNVIGSIATSTAAGFQVYDGYWWWLVLDRGDVVGAACRTEPYCLQLGPMDSDAAASLAHSVAAHDDAFPCVNGDEQTVRRFLDGYAATGSPGSRRQSTADFENIIYEAGAINVPDVPGEVRPATMPQFELASTWMTDFTTFINGKPYQPSHHDSEALRARISASMLYLWWVDSEPVSMVGHASPVTIGTETVTRIAPVFTPRERRRRGFAAAATAAVTNLLSESATRVVLLADANYPTSNHVYQSIGYFEVDRLVRFQLT